MVRSKYSIWFWFLVSALLLSGMVLGSSPITSAQVVYPPTEDRGAPERTSGSGSRGCGDYIVSDDHNELAALMPANNISTTVDPQTSLYFYVPPTQGSQAELTLYDWTNKNRTPVYQTQLSVKQTSGIVKLTLPKTVELKSDNIYVWNFSIYCSSNPNEAYQYADGWLQRVTLTAQQQAQLEQRQQPLEQAQLYAEAGIWANALEIVAQLRSSHPQVWQRFLDSVALSHLAQYPMIDYRQVTIAHQNDDFVE